MANRRVLGCSSISSKPPTSHFYEVVDNFFIFDSSLKFLQDEEDEEIVSKKRQKIIDSELTMCLTFERNVC